MNRNILIALATSSLLTLAVVGLGSCKKESHGHEDEHADHKAHGGHKDGDEHKAAPHADHAGHKDVDARPPAPPADHADHAGHKDGDASADGGSR